MKKMLSLVLTAALLAGIFCVTAMADGSGGQVRVIMSSPDVTVTEAEKDQIPAAEDLDEAMEQGAELIPEDCKLLPGRITVLGTGNLSCEEEVYYVSFKVWSTVGRTVGLFFRAEDSEEWELISCNLGDVIEGQFETAGTYTIVVGW